MITIKNAEWLQKELDQIVPKSKCNNCKHGFWQSGTWTRFLMFLLVLIPIFGCLASKTKTDILFHLFMVGGIFSFIVVFHNILHSSSRWEWCDNIKLRKSEAEQKAADWDRMGPELGAHSAWYRGLKTGVPRLKKEWNANGDCMYYKRKWWKFWVRK